MKEDRQTWISGFVYGILLTIIGMGVILSGSQGIIQVSPISVVAGILVPSAILGGLITMVWISSKIKISKKTSIRDWGRGKPERRVSQISKRLKHARV
jgi:phosphate/sulfate permease